MSAVPCGCLGHDKAPSGWLPGPPTVHFGEVSAGPSTLRPEGKLSIKLFKELTSGLTHRFCPKRVPSLHTNNSLWAERPLQCGVQWMVHTHGHTGGSSQTQTRGPLEVGSQTCWLTR